MTRKARSVKKSCFSRRNYSYWEDRNTTSDECEIINKFFNKKKIFKKNILHIGVGNSDLAKSIDPSNNILGISLSYKEIFFGKSLNLKNYKILFCDKYSKNFSKILKKKKFDFIIDTNLKSYACCQSSFDFMMHNIFNSLKKKGILITSTKGMNWYKSLKPKLSFDFTNFFHFKMKEEKGNPNSILTKSELRKICLNYRIKIFFNQNLCYLTK